MNSPRRIYIELNNICNLTCGFCPYPRLDRHPKSMDLEMVKEILKDIKTRVPYRIIYFHNLSEPLLYKELEYVLEYCDHLGITYGITTNGLLLASKIDMLAGAKIHEINLSYEVIREDLHHERGIRISVDQYRSLMIDGIEKLFSRGYRGMIKIKLLTTNRHSVYEGRVFTNIGGIKEFIHEVNRLYLGLCRRELSPGQVKKISKINIHRHTMMQVRENIIIESFPFLNWGNYKQKVWPAFLGKCDAVYGQLVIMADGDVHPCCYDVDGDLVMGNVTRQPLHLILASEKGKTMERKAHSIFVHNKRCRQCQGSISLGRGLKKHLCAFFPSSQMKPSKKVIII